MSATITYVLDTSVLLSDPRAMLRFAEHEVVIPLVVVSELEGKRDHPELGYTARHALANLDELRDEHGRLDRPFPVGKDGGMLRVEINHVDSTHLPRTFDRAENDTRILAVARNLQAEGATVVVVTKDVPMRIKAASLGLQAQEYLNEQAGDASFTGMSSLDLDEEQMSSLFDTGWLQTDCVAHEAVNTGLVLSGPRSSALRSTRSPTNP